MALIEWKRHYSVGVKAVDHEHRELIDLINRLHEELLAGTSNPAVTAFLGEIFRSISAHFALEERFMREHRYDHFTEHKQAHEQLLEEVREIMDSYDGPRHRAGGRGCAYWRKVQAINALKAMAASTSPATI
jgi:hemerythrin